MKRTRIAAMSAKRRAQFEEEGIEFPLSTFAPKSRLAAPKRAKDTGPPRTVRDLVAERSGGVCEFRWCVLSAVHVHHRRPRGYGGSRAAVTNSPSNLLHLCLLHHEWVESRRKKSYELGVLVPQSADPAQVPVLTRHHPEPVWLTPAGSWVPFEEACA